PTDGPPILTDADGTRYFDGKTSLIVIDKSGQRIDWTLPAVASGQGDVHLFRTSDGLLFLFNEPGRVLRIKRTPKESEPFTIEATFTHDVPNAQNLQRVWLDPAGRIVIAYEGSKLAILFPSGRVPPAISEMMPASD